MTGNDDDDNDDNDKNDDDDDDDKDINEKEDSATSIHDDYNITRHTMLLNHHLASFTIATNLQTERTIGSPLEKKANIANDKI